MRSKVAKSVSWVFIVLMLIFTYLPIVILIIFSFAPESKAIGNWAKITWSLDLYAELFKSEEILTAIGQTVQFNSNGNPLNSEYLFEDCWP